jgi:ABC-type sugar transport system permease subunit
MGTTAVEVSGKPERKKPSATISGMLIRLIVLGIYDVFAVWLITNMFLDGYMPLAIIMVIITIFLNVAFLREGMYPLRWMAIGLSLMLLITVYPIIYTVFISFTNYGDGNLLTQQQANEQLEKQQYLPESGTTFSWTAFQAPDGEYALWLVDADGNSFFARPGEPRQEVANPEEFGELDEDGIPLEVEGYTRLNRLQTVPLIDSLAAVDFGDEDTGVVKIRNLDSASTTVPRYEYDADTDTMTDLETGVVYTPVEGTYTAEDGSTISPGFWVGIGTQNYTKFFSSPAIAGPLILVTIWNFVFAFLTVFTTFFLGLFTAMLFNDLKGKRIIRSLLIIPYTIPSLVTILVWKGMLNEQIGIITNMLEATIGYSPPWFTDPTWAKIGILIVNLWLGYPYFMLVCSGALQGIPQDIYSAADVDGAGASAKFRKLTLPLLLIAVGPLLIASFTFNFNNFNVIYLYNEGGPPIAGAPTPVGHTDILISYVYKLAFGGARGADYGFASAISIIIFGIVVVITLFQFRYTNMWEAGEDV